MSSSASPNVDNASSASILKPISPTLRNRLQKYHGFGQQKQKEGDYDYAHAMFAQCVVADPANMVYVESMLNNLFAKYRGQKKKPKLRANRAPFKKALADEDWLSVLKQGPELLEQSPWDIPTLRGLAQACAALRQLDERFNDIELRYLRTALDGDPKNIEVNQHCAESLARMGQFDQAIACWHRIEELSSGKSLAQKHISDLTVLKNMRASGMLEDPSTSTVKKVDSSSSKADADAKVSSSASAASESGVKLESAPRTIDELEQAISKSPEDVDKHLQLAKLFEAKGNWQEVERVLRRAVQASGNDVRIVERLENVQIRRGRLHLATVEARAKANPTTDHQELARKVKTDLNRLELGIYNNRAQRYPDQLNYRFELAVCLKRAGSFKQAAQYFDEASSDTKLEAAARVQRGECLQQIRQYREAMQSYLAGVKSAAAAEPQDDKSLAVQKLGLYRAGVLAMGLKDLDQAQKLLEKLVALDPKYLDARARLDKLQKARDNQ